MRRGYAKGASVPLPTSPLERNPKALIRTIAVEILEGPDAGLRFEATSDTLTIGSSPTNDLAVKDRSVSGFHLELGRCPSGVTVRDLESTNGTWLGSAQIGYAVIPAGTVLTIGVTRLKVMDGSETAVDLSLTDRVGKVLGTSPNMRRLMAQVERVARTQVGVLLTGESGTGKELLAQALHELGSRPQGPFVTVDCGSLAPGLVASELFGHERGAFTGAIRQHEGAFERAHGGTLFLDEIGELPADLQPQLLGVLERQRFRRVGGKNDIEVDVRVVSATNRDLRSEVNEGRFRLDLFYRVSVVELRIPPLREREGDIPLLVNHFLLEAGHDGPVEDIVSKDVMSELARYRWPGNVRELRNWTEATLAMGESATLREEQRPLAEPQGTYDLDRPYKTARHHVLEAFERNYLARLLEVSNGNVSLASRRAGMDRTYLIKLLQKHRFK